MDDRGGGIPVLAEPPRTPAGQTVTFLTVLSPECLSDPPTPKEEGFFFWKLPARTHPVAWRCSLVPPSGRGSLLAREPGAFQACQMKTQSLPPAQGHPRRSGQTYSRSHS